MMPGVRSLVIPNVNGLAMHVWEAGFERHDAPCVLLLHGFPELGYSWRHVMLPLATAGYRVVAPDQRGYGRTTGWDARYDGDLDSFRLPNLVADALALVAALGYSSVHAVVGHDFGSPVAAYCALLRPDVFRSVVLMSAPFAGVPSQSKTPPIDLDAALAALHPPRKHYTSWFSTPMANDDMLHAPQGLHAFLRAYFYLKSGDWTQNAPHSLGEYSARAFATLPRYYVMDAGKGMAQTVSSEMAPGERASRAWLTDEELAHYAREFARTGFQGGLQWYRCKGPKYIAEFAAFDGRTIDVPSAFIAGERDWGVYQSPGAFEAMQEIACTKMVSCELVAGAGHWVQQERPEAVAASLLRFLGSWPL